MLIVTAAVLVLVVGVGAGTSYLRQSPNASASGDANDATLARLKDYTRSLGPEKPAPKAGEPLPDVNVMIERLAARLQTAPDDVKGWRMLGWSYYHTGRYEEAAAAYERAVALDPNSAELKRAYDEAKAQASGRDNLDTASASQTEPVGKGGDGSRAGKVSKSEAAPQGEQDAAIRSMVDGLANRLENSPRDVEGWTRLMRSRVVLGQRDVAATALHKALEVFRDDQAASGRIKAAAIELGLKAE
jgi:cytochrome c-type biogenesis protein CcmH